MVATYLDPISTCVCKDFDGTEEECFATTRCEQKRQLERFVGNYNYYWYMQIATGVLKTISVGYINLSKFS